MGSFTPRFLAAALLLLSACDAGTSGPCSDTNCADYTSQPAAQAAFDADPVCRDDLDADDDGTACEESGNSVRLCPTTSSCGCSNKNKDACGADACCRWVVGSGCGCR